MVRQPRRNEGKTWSPSPDKAGARGRPRPPVQAVDPDWIWGWNPVLAALANPARGAPRRLLATPERARQLQAQDATLAKPELVDAAAIARTLPPKAPVRRGWR